MQQIAEMKCLLMLFYFIFIFISLLNYFGSLQYLILFQFMFILFQGSGLV